MTDPITEAREALAEIRALVASLAGRLNHVETHWTPDERSAPMSTADVMREFDRLAAGVRRQGPVTDAEVRVAVKAYKAPRLHVNDTQIDREIDMRAALEAVRDMP